MPLEPRIRVSAVLRWEGRVLLCRHEKSGRGEYWLLPGGGVNSGESLVEGLRRELTEEVGIGDDLTFEGPVAVVDSIAPKRAFVGEARRAHHLRGRPLGTLARSASPRRTRPCAAIACSTRVELDDVVLHPPIQRFLGRWQPGDPAVYLGALWAP